MYTLTSFWFKIVQGGLSAKLLALGMFGLIGTMTIFSLTRNEKSSLQRLRDYDQAIKDADEHGVRLEQRTEVVRQRNSRRMEVVHDVAAGRLSKERAAQLFLEMNQSDPEVQKALQMAYSTSDDLECAMKQLEKFLIIFKEFPPKQTPQTSRVGTR